VIVCLERIIWSFMLCKSNYYHRSTK